MLKMTGVELERISDPTLYQTIEQAIRGGYSTVKERYWKTDMPEDIEGEDGANTWRCLYVDANNRKIIKNSN